MKLNNYKTGIEKCLSPLIKKTKDNALAVSALLKILQIFATKDFQKSFIKELSKNDPKS
jgi:hypothetical protein